MHVFAASDGDLGEEIEGVTPESHLPETHACPDPRARFHHAVYLQSRRLAPAETARILFLRNDSPCRSRPRPLIYC